MIFLACASCKDDPDLVAKRDRQGIEIARLQGEVALAQERIKNMPEDMGDELTVAETQLQELALEANRLDSEIAELQGRKAELERDFAAYKEKYPLN